MKIIAVTLHLVLTLLWVLPASSAHASQPATRKQAVGSFSRFVDPLTANLQFSVPELEVPGSQGGLAFGLARYGNSRDSGLKRFFGAGHNWTHSWQWEVRSLTGSDGSLSELLLLEPTGKTRKFLNTANGTWRSFGENVALARQVATGVNIQLSDGRELRFQWRNHNTTSELDLKFIVYQGLTWILERSENGLLNKVTEPAGRWLEFEYNLYSGPDNNGQTITIPLIHRVVSSLRQTVSYEYSYGPAGEPLLSRVNFDDGGSTRYTYINQRATKDSWLLEYVEGSRSEGVTRGTKYKYANGLSSALGQLEAIVSKFDDEEILSVATIRNSFGTETTFKLKGGDPETFVFSNQDQLTSWTDSLGFIAKYSYDATNGNKLENIDKAGRRTSFEYDLAGRLVKSVFPDATSEELVFDGSGQVIEKKMRNGIRVRYSRDKWGRIQTISEGDGGSEVMQYNDLGQVTLLIDKAGGQILNKYDARGLLFESKAIDGRITQYEYDEFDRQVKQVEEGEKTTVTIRDRAGRVVLRKTPDGRSKSFKYDIHGDLIQVHDSVTGDLFYTYDTFGRRVSILDERGMEKDIKYTLYPQINMIGGRPLKITSTDGTTEFEYDQLGRITDRVKTSKNADLSSVHLSYSPDGKIQLASDHRGRTINFRYDDDGRLHDIIKNSGEKTSFEYDRLGRVTSRVGANNSVATFEYDDFGRVLAEMDSLGHRTTKTYDTSGRISEITTASGSVYRFSYDVMSRFTRIEYPDNSYEEFEYDRNLETSFRARSGHKRTIKHNSAGQKTLVSWDDGSPPTNYVYNTRGQLMSEDNGIAKTSYEYNVDGTLSRETQNLYPAATKNAYDPEPTTVTYVSNRIGKVADLLYPSGVQLHYLYYLDGRMKSVAEDGSGILTLYLYDSLGNVTSVARGNGLISNLVYNTGNRLETLKESDSLGVISESIISYDVTGNRSREVSVNESGIAETTLVYDAVNQLVERRVRSGVSVGSLVETSLEAFSFDQSGNRITSTRGLDQTKYLSNNLDQYTIVSGNRLSYDANGNLIFDGGVKFIYDNDNKIVSAQKGDSVVYFFYDSRGRCVSQVKNNQTETFVYNKWQVLERYRNGIREAYYVYGKGADDVVSISTSAGRTYLHQDSIGSVTHASDVRGNIVERYIYSASGETKIIARGGAEVTKSGIGNDSMFLGRRFITDLGIYDLRHRMYSPRLGRFLQPDPSRFRIKDLNLQRYAWNNPVRFKDPFGLDIWVLNDREGAGGAGHIASIVGNDVDGFTYLSWDARDPNTNTDNLKEEHFSSLQDAVDAAQNDRPGDGYDDVLHFNTTPLDDMYAIYAYEDLDGTDYNLLTNNCLDAVKGMLDTADIDYGYSQVPNSWANAEKMYADDYADYEDYIFDEGE